MTMLLMIIVVCEW